MAKFLFIRFSSIGDIILTTPLLRALKQQVADSEIHYLTKENFKSLVQFNPHITKIHYYNSNLVALLNTLKKENFDYIIDLHNNARTLRVKRNLKKPSYSLKKLNFLKWVLVNFKFNYLPEKHIVDRYFDTLSNFKVVNDKKGLDFYFNERNIGESFLKLASLKPGYIAFAIGAGHNTKKLPTEKIIQICSQLKLPVVLLGDKNDFENGKQIESKLSGKVINACGKASLFESAFLLRNSLLLITHDTGLMHIASAFHKNIISVWGNTVPEFGMYPYMPDEKEKFSIIEVENLRCRPCSKIGFKKCPKKHFNCMNKINIDSIIEKADKYLQQELFPERGLN